jgi:hypothetical protein
MINELALPASLTLALSRKVREIKSRYASFTLIDTLEI